MSSGDRPAWPAGVLASVEKAALRSRELVGVVDRYLPVAAGEDNRHDSWQVTGPALIARGRNTLESLTAVAAVRHRADASILLRSLFEHFVSFAWLAADPANRMPNWLASDATQRLKIDADFRTIGEPVFDEKVRREMEARRSAAAAMPALPERAVRVDEEWGTRLRELNAISPHVSARGIYRAVYREGSSFTHPTIYGIEPVVDGSQQTVFVRAGERPPEHPGALVLGPLTYALELFVSAEALGWPMKEEIHSVFKRHP